MLQNEYESEDPNGIKDKKEIMKKDATDPLSAKHILCRQCRLPKIGSNQVQPNGLRGCKCDELSPYYNSNFPNINLDSRGLVSNCPQKIRHAQLPEQHIIKNPDSSEKEKCSVGVEPPKERSFVPPQGMDAGQYPRALFYQYYRIQNEVCTFDLLPLPFMDRLRYREMCALSIDNPDIKKKWKDFLYKLPNSEFQLPVYPDDRFWRWRQYLRYVSDETRNEFRYKMQTGPKYDRIGRLPITGEDLNIFRDIKTKPKSKSNYILTKGNGIKK